MGESWRDIFGQYIINTFEVLFYKSKVARCSNRVGRDGDAIPQFTDVVDVDLGFIGSEEAIKFADMGVGLSEDFCHESPLQTFD